MMTKMVMVTKMMVAEMAAVMPRIGNSISGKTETQQSYRHRCYRHQLVYSQASHYNTPSTHLLSGKSR
jgi:hypothetical protein